MNVGPVQAATIGVACLVVAFTSYFVYKKFSESMTLVSFSCANCMLGQDKQREKAEEEKYANEEKKWHEKRAFEESLKGSFIIIS